MALKTIEKSSIGDIVFEQFMNAISTNEWSPGSKIPSENELSKTLGVSRVTVRGALQRLAALDLIETKHGEGSFVKALNGTQNFNALMPTFLLGSGGLFHMLEFRKIFECGSAALAAAKAEEADIHRLETALSGMKNTALSITARRQFDTDFHAAVGTATKNNLIEKVYEILGVAFYSSIGETAQYLGFDNAILYHSRILDAIKQKDKDGAYNAMLEHISDTADRMSAIMSASADDTPKDL